MKEIENNIHAFPLIDEEGNYIQLGMMLRDHFAGLAIQILLTSLNDHDRILNEEGESLLKYKLRAAYKVADAMLEERTKTI